MLDPSRSNSPPPFTVLDKVKCSLFVPVESSKNSSNSVHFITASGEGSDIVYFYTYEGRGQGYPVEGKTTGLYWFRNYLVVTYQARYLYNCNIYTQHSKLMARVKEDDDTLTKKIQPCDRRGLCRTK